MALIILLAVFAGLMVIEAIINILLYKENVSMHRKVADLESHIDVLLTEKQLKRKM